jgi:hypothetical protein
MCERAELVAELAGESAEGGTLVTSRPCAGAGGGPRRNGCRTLIADFRRCTEKRFAR